VRETPAPRIILIVEEDEQVRGLVRKLLAKGEYRLHEAHTCAEGLAIARSLEKGIDLLIADVSLPDRSGWDLAEQIHREFPRARFLLLADYVEGESAKSDSGRLGSDILGKPFSPAALRRKVRQALASEAS